MNTDTHTHTLFDFLLLDGGVVDLNPGGATTVSLIGKNFHQVMMRVSFDSPKSLTHRKRRAAWAWSD